MTELPTQPEVETACPDCGNEPTAGSIALHKLSSMGYAHDDQMFECGSCGNEWYHGVPIGESDPFDSDLACENPLCEREWCRVHRVKLARVDDELQFLLHKKCPECYFFGKVTREPDNADIALVGYPDITGDTDDAEPYGYPEDAF